MLYTLKRFDPNQVLKKQVRIVLTGGPSAGKTTLLGLLYNQYQGKVSIAQEAAHHVFSSGMKRPENFDEALHVQKKIFSLQKELEESALKNSPSLPLICDRGSLDGSAYYPGDLSEYCNAMGTSIKDELDRYTAVIHLESAACGNVSGYKNTQIRTETPDEAAALDQRISENWGIHPQYVFIPNSRSFSEKLTFAMQSLQPFLPETFLEEVHPKFRFATATDLFSTNIVQTLQ